MVRFNFSVCIVRGVPRGGAAHQHVMLPSSISLKSKWPRPAKLPSLARLLFLDHREYFLPNSQGRRQLLIRSEHWSIKMAIRIEEANKQILVQALETSAGKAIASTIRDWEGLEKALDLVKLDLERRFELPDVVNLRALFTGGGTWADVTKLTFLRSGGVWHLEAAVRKRPTFMRNYIRYEADSYAYEMFRLYVRDGRSMPSVDYGEDRILSAHEQLNLVAIQRQKADSQRDINTRSKT